MVKWKKIFVPQRTSTQAVSGAVLRHPETSTARDGVPQVALQRGHLSSTELLGDGSIDHLMVPMTYGPLNGESSRKRALTLQLLHTC